MVHLETTRPDIVTKTEIHLHPAKTVEPKTLGTMP